MPQRKSAFLHLRMDAGLKAAAARAAADDQVTLTSYVELLLEDNLRERGYLPKEAQQ